MTSDPRPSPGPPAILALAVAVAAISLAAIFVRLAAAPGVVVAAGRLLLASLLLAPWTLRALRRTPPRGAALRRTLLAGVLLGGHFATWISSLGYTSVAASVTLVTTTPLWVALLGWWLGRRPPRRAVLAGALLAVLGGGFIALGDAGGTGAALAAPRPLLGNGLALAGAVFMAGYLLLGRAVQRSGVGTGAFVGAAYAVAALVLLPLPALLGHPYLGWPAATWAWIAALALVPQLLGHTGLAYAVARLDPTTVATTTLLEPIGAALLALLLFGEVPTPVSGAGALLVLAGVAFTVRSSGARRGGRAAAREATEREGLPHR